MFDKKFKAPMEEELERIDKDKQRYKMKAVLIQQLQDQAQNSMEATFDTDDYLELFQPEIQIFF